jgi:hemoglobin-like flavoprotein
VYTIERQRYEEWQSSYPIVEDVPRHWSLINTSRENAEKFGQLFYTTLFTDLPEAMVYFAETDMDQLAAHFVSAIDLVVKICSSGKGVNSLRSTLEYLGRVHGDMNIPSAAYPVIFPSILTTLNTVPLRPETASAWTKMYKFIIFFMAHPVKMKEKLLNAVNLFRHELLSMCGDGVYQITDNRYIEVHSHHLH